MWARSRCCVRRGKYSTRSRGRHAVRSAGAHAPVGGARWPRSEPPWLSYGVQEPCLCLGYWLPFRTPQPPGPKTTKGWTERDAGVVVAPSAHRSQHGVGLGLLGQRGAHPACIPMPGEGHLSVSVPVHAGSGRPRAGGPAPTERRSHLRRHGLPQGTAPHRGQGGAAGTQAAESAGELRLEHHCPEGEGRGLCGPLPTLPTCTWGMLREHRGWRGPIQGVQAVPTPSEPPSQVLAGGAAQAPRRGSGQPEWHSPGAGP